MRVASVLAALLSRPAAPADRAPKARREDRRRLAGARRPVAALEDVGKVFTRNLDTGGSPDPVSQCRAVTWKRGKPVSVGGVVPVGPVMPAGRRCVWPGF
jgi:hypothetical protein